MCHMERLLFTTRRFTGTAKGKLVYYITILFCSLAVDSLGYNNIVLLKLIAVIWEKVPLSNKHEKSV